MIENLNLDQMHIDVHLYKQINNKYTYFKPLIVQPFTETENKKTWCYLCDNSILDNSINTIWKGVIHKLNLEKEDFTSLNKGWNIAYFIMNNLIYIIILIILILFVISNIKNIKKLFIN